MNIKTFVKSPFAIIVTIFVSIVVLAVIITGIYNYAVQQVKNNDSALCNSLNSEAKQHLASFFTSSKSEGVQYKCGIYLGSFPVKSWQILYTQRGEFESNKTQQELQTQIDTQLTEQGWSKVKGNNSLIPFSLESNSAITVRTKILSARYNLYQITVTGGNNYKTSGDKNTQKPTDIPLSKSILKTYSPFAIPTLSYAPEGTSWSAVAVDAQKLSFDLETNTPVKPSLYVTQKAINDIPSLGQIGTGSSANAIYVTDANKGDFVTQVNGLTHSLYNVRNSYSKIKLSDDEVIKIYNGIKY